MPFHFARANTIVMARSASVSHLFIVKCFWSNRDLNDAVMCKKNSSYPNLKCAACIIIVLSFVGGFSLVP